MIRICKCGRIHKVDEDKLDVAIESNKNLLHICGGCGAATLIGADREIDGNYLYQVDYSYHGDAIINVSHFESAENYKGIYEILYSQGYRVPMMSGEYATNFACNKFSDMLYPNFYEIDRQNVSADEVHEFICTYHRERTTVNMDRFIRETPDEVLEELSHYVVRAFDWTGTKWEKR